ncbi:TrmH family RNA methyltransferase [Advenella sp. RU8]|uniref:TrmH family RNA methyltransferase n=1 Tax=Advenella sp. RU8 TaxID=3399575 RepID=UPI003AAC3E9A
MKTITSKDNPLYKQLLKTHLGKIKGHVLIEGVHLCHSWLAHFSAPLMAVFNAAVLDRAQTGFTEHDADAYAANIRAQQSEPLLQSSSNEVGELFSLLDTANRIVVPDKLFRALTHVDAPQGVLFLVSIPVCKAPPAINENSLFLDRLQDPGNAGTILRSAAAAGIRHVYLSKGSVSAWSSKVLRSAQGAHFALNIYEQQDLSALINQASVPVLATALSEKAQNLYEIRLPEQCIWLMGHEGQGVHPDLLARATHQVFIPQTDLVESLNVGVAAGIVLFEHRRQRLYNA